MILMAIICHCYKHILEEIYMSKQKSITEQIEELQEANKMLSNYEKLFDKACQINFGCSSKSIKKILMNNEDPCSSFEAKMRSFFCLKTDADIADFIATMCTESTRNYFLNKREKAAGEEQG